jgi:hypothetical protein
VGQIATARRWGTALVVLATVVAVTTFVQRSGPTVAGRGCPAAVATAVLPTWARSGFSDPVPSAPHVVGDRGEIVAILFGDLAEPQRADHGNKILWVARDDAGAPLTVTATLGADDPAPVVQTLPDGPGPSTVDLPAPGCWTFDLSWGAQHDTLRLPYAPG